MSYTVGKLKILEQLKYERPEVQLVEALAEVLAARESLETAKRNVPSYTGQHEPYEYYRHEMIDYEFACQKFLEKLRIALKEE